MSRIETTPPDTHILSDAIDLPHGVTLAMCSAGMTAWDEAHKQGVRHWPTMLGRVFIAMRDARNDADGHCPLCDKP